MTKEDIIRMARKAEIEPDSYQGWLGIEELEHFAALVRADEREACAKVCYRHAALIGDPIDQERIFQCAAAIRARSNT